MPMIEWNDNLFVNVKEIDRQHKELVNMLNYLNDAMISGVDNIAAIELIEKMKDYAAYHFSTEETLMDQYQYPGISDHKHQHEEFSKKIVQVETDSKNRKSAISMDILNFLCDWVVTHVSETDKKLGDFLNKAGVY